MNADQIKQESNQATRTQILERLKVEPGTYAAVKRQFPVQWPIYYLNLVDDLDGPIARMGRPDMEELAEDTAAIEDPVADLAMRPHPHVVQKHPDRVILLATKKCHFYCRYCFRRAESFTSSHELDSADWQSIFRYLRANPTIQEPILSGGDPLTLTDEKLIWIREQLEKIPSIQRWRIHTRAPVHYPQRITEALVAGLVGKLPLRIVTQFNHAQEITLETRRITALIVGFGIELKNQAVLLAGINDTQQVQLELWTDLAKEGIIPHYLHHPDRVAGNRAFRVSISQGRAHYEAFRASYKGRPPAYVLDLPDGRGKVPVMDLKPLGGQQWEYQHQDGTKTHYQDFEINGAVNL